MLEYVAIVWKIISTRFYINGADHTTNQTFQFRPKLTDVTRNFTLLSSSQQETGHTAILIEENNELFLSSPYESHHGLFDTSHDLSIVQRPANKLFRFWWRRDHAPRPPSPQYLYLGLCFVEVLMKNSEQRLVINNATVMCKRPLWRTKNWLNCTPTYVVDQKKNYFTKIHDFT